MLAITVTSSVPAISGSDAELRRLEERRPLGPGEEVDDRDLAEELEGGQEERDDDPDRRRDRDQGADAEEDLDDVLAVAPPAGAEPELHARGQRRSTPTTAPVAASRSALAFVSCSSVSGTNCDGLRDRLLVVEQEAQERLHLGPRERLLLHVDEERARERLVGAVLRARDARRDAAVAAVDLECLERVLVLLEVGEAEVAEAALLARDAGDDHVVVLAGRVVGAARALLAVDLVGEVVERAGVGAGAEKLHLLVGEGRVDILPAAHLRVGLPDLLQLLGGEAVDPVVVLVHDDREGVVRDLELDVVDAGVLADRRFFVLDRARGVGEVGLAAAEALEAAAGAGDADRDLDARLLALELLRRRRRVRADRARAVRLDPAGEVAAAGAGGRRRPARVLVAAASAAAAGEQDEQAEQERNSGHRFSVVRHTASLAALPRRRGCRMVKIR